MSDLAITLKLPDDLVERMNAADIRLDVDSITTEVISLLERRIARKQAWAEINTMASQLRGSLTPEEIEAELLAAKMERIADSTG
jgi:hypothetical protein